MKYSLVSACVVCVILAACGGPATADSAEVARLVDEAVRATVSAMPTPEPVVIVVTPTAPPQPTLAPHDTPDGIARAWVEAWAAGDCARLASYLSPDRSGRYAKYCGHTAIYCMIDYRIDDAVVRSADRPERRFVNLVGEFSWDRSYDYVEPIGPCEDDDRIKLTYSTWEIRVEQLGEKWYFVTTEGDGYLRF